MKQFTFRVTEKYVVHETIEAETREEAEQEIVAKYENGELYVDYFDEYNIELIDEEGAE